MTFNANVPNAGQSPGLFPPQNNTNFGRLKTIIETDHVFNDTAADTDGVHKQMTMVARDSPTTPPGLPTGINGILYSWVDGDGKAQMRWFNGDTDVQMTPPDILSPIRVVGSQSVTAGNTVTAYSNPGFTYAGTGWALISGNNIFRFYSILRSGSNDLNEIDSNSGVISRPTFSFSGSNLQITNNDGSTRTLRWSLIINRLT